MLEKVPGGYKVKREHGKGYFSKKPQSKAKALAQLRVIEAAKHGTHYGSDDDLECDREKYDADDECGCGCEDTTGAPRKPHREAKGRVRLGYDDMDDEVPVGTVKDARAHLKRCAACASEGGMD